MTTARLLELAVAVALLVAGTWFYRRRDPSGQQGGQGAVLLFAVAVIVGIHALGGMDYRPSPTELEAMKAKAR